MDACSQCPHPNDCLKVGNCLDDLNGADIARRMTPRLMTPAQANAAMAAMVAGQSKRQFTHGKFPIVTPRKLRKHCAAYSTYGAEIARLSEKNIANVNARKSANQHMKLLTAEFCSKRLHRMTPDNAFRYQSGGPLAKAMRSVPLHRANTTTFEVDHSQDRSHQERDAQRRFSQSNYPRKAAWRGQGGSQPDHGAAGRVSIFSHIEPRL